MGRPGAKARSKTGSRDRENIGSVGKWEKHFGNNLKGVSDQEIDDTMENADWVHDFSNELDTLETQDRNKK